VNFRLNAGVGLLPIAIFASIATWHGNASGQEPQQTPENAVRFFNNLAQGRYYSISATYYTWPAFTDWAKVTGATATGRCVTVFSTDPPKFLESAGNGNPPSSDSARYAVLATQYRVARPPFTIDWSKVTKITRHDRVAQNPNSMPTGHADHILISGTESFNFSLMDEAIAQRFEYAANFMKSICDPTADTGF
jgi:hypothetical protein